MSHRFQTEVFYEDTDMGGIVYHANFLKFIERGRSAWVRSIGIDQLALRDQGLVFAVRAIDARFLRPARLGDALTVTTEPVEHTGARMTLSQQVHVGDTALFSARVELAAMTLAGKPTRLPADLRAALVRAGH